MRFARVENGVVAEIFEAPNRKALRDQLHPDFVALLLKAPDDAEVGWTVTGDTWAPPVEPEPAPTPPRALTAIQFWSAALALGIRESDVEAMLETIIAEPEAREMARIKLRKATQFERNDPLLLAITADLPITPEQIDAAWLAVQGA